MTKFGLDFPLPPCITHIVDEYGQEWQGKTCHVLMAESERFALLVNGPYVQIFTKGVMVLYLLNADNGQLSHVPWYQLQHRSSWFVNATTAFSGRDVHPLGLWRIIFDVHQVVERIQIDHTIDHTASYIRDARELEGNELVLTSTHLYSCTPNTQTFKKRPLPLHLPEVLFAQLPVVVVENVDPTGMIETSLLEFKGPEWETEEKHVLTVPSHLCALVNRARFAWEPVLRLLCSAESGSLCWWSLDSHAPPEVLFFKWDMNNDCMGIDSAENSDVILQVIKFLPDGRVIVWASMIENDNQSLVVHNKLFTLHLETRAMQTHDVGEFRDMIVSGRYVLLLTSDGSVITLE